MLSPRTHTDVLVGCRVNAGGAVRRNSRVMFWRDGVTGIRQIEASGTTPRVPATESARALHHSLPSLRTEGAGKVGWPLHPGPSRRKNVRERENHRYRRRHSGLPCAMGYGLYGLSSVNHSVCHRCPRDAKHHRELERQTLGRQDHTISPSAGSAARQSAPSRPPHPRLTSRDDRDTPLRKRGGMRGPYV
jgi:hypothetical protein